ncbi:unnamed protein product [Acanthosepion pharaonis]|uniref:Reverse transcriptase domain-containing protein n=1 Tax=Acanthosepion pharaonis TaxID=158019 RepID=A0A812CHM9_ACAPH|nr:unnamed protein product [Sepia pharaonis]
MDEVLRGLPSFFDYIDDILIASEDAASHKRHLNEVFQRLSHYGFPGIVSVVLVLVIFLLVWLGILWDFLVGIDFCIGGCLRIHNIPFLFFQGDARPRLNFFFFRPVPSLNKVRTLSLPSSSLLNFQKFSSLSNFFFFSACYFQTDRPFLPARGE